MSTNFKINTRTINGNLHLELRGVFDGSSACELANKIMLRYDKNRQVIINCEKLEKVLPFGTKIFNYLMKSSMISMDRLIFKGRKAVEIQSLHPNLFPTDKKKRNSSGSRRYTTRCSIM